MTRAGRAVAAVAGVLFACPLMAGPCQAQAVRQAAPQQTTVLVADHLGAGQQEEIITVYFDGVAAGTLHVDRSRPNDQLQANLPVQPSIGFTLCGRLIRRESDGSLSTHLIDNGGVLSSYRDASLAAVTLGDVLFALQDDKGQATTDVRPGPSCTAAVS